MSCDLAKRIEVLEKQIALIIKKKQNDLILKDKPLSEYEVFCNDKKNRTCARKKLIDEADDGKLPTEDQIKKQLDKMWQSNQEDKQFFAENYRSMKK